MLGTGQYLSFLRLLFNSHPHVSAIPLPVVNLKSLSLEHDIIVLGVIDGVSELELGDVVVLGVIYGVCELELGDVIVLGVIDGVSESCTCV
jgi:hypothetical protein